MSSVIGMSMKEMLLKRLEEIEKAIAQAMANINMMEGGKQEILYWIKKVDEESISRKESISLQVRDNSCNE